MRSCVWARQKALLIISDDWGMCAWSPTVQVYEEMHPLEFMRNPWSSGTLETPTDMERLFALLESYRGGDGLPALFEPMYIVGNPDFDAMKANEFAAYVDIGLDRGVPEGWDRGNLIAKAREGTVRGVWHPGYHGRAHHLSPEHWMRRLRERDEWARFAFERKMYVCELVRDRQPEYSTMDDDQLQVWIGEGLARFQSAFGYLPRCARNGDFTPSAIQTLAGKGIRAIVKDRTTDDWDDRVYPLSPLIHFEPFLTADHEDVVSRVLSEIEREWASGSPAILSTHRRNYKGFDQGDVERNFACLRKLLGGIAGRHPDAVYLCGNEIAQLTRSGISIIRRGEHVICRNYGEQTTSVAVDIDNAQLSLSVPVGELIIRLKE